MSRVHRSLPRLWLLGTLLLAAGCAETEGQLPSLSPVPFGELKQKVSRLRELPFLQDVSAQPSSMEAIQGMLEKSVTAVEERERLDQKVEVYARLGLLEEKTDLAKALLDLRLLHHPVFADARRQILFVPSGSLKTGFTVLGPFPVTDETASQLLSSYALSHILQEQHFHWEEKIRNGATEDARLALRALREGDAALVALAHLVGDSKESRQKILSSLQGLGRLPARLDKELANFPELLRRKLAFQIVQGSKFVLWAYTLKGWNGINALFHNPPASTEQLLHPEKYYIKREEPLRIVPWVLIRRGSGQKILDETMGEFLIEALLARSVSDGEARQAAAGWAGDNLLAFRHGRELVLGWVTAWDGASEAREFHAAFLKALERRHGVSLRPSQGRSDLLTAALPGGRSLLLQLREPFVFFLDGVSPPLSLSIAEELWSELETGAGPEPLELGRSARHSWPLKK